MIRAILVTGVVALLAAPAFGHDVELTKVVATFRVDGRYQIDMHYDVDAWVVGARPAHMSEADRRQLDAMPAAEREKRLAELRDFVLRGVRIRFDEGKHTPAIEFVDNPEKPTTRVSDASPLVRIVRLRGDIPPGARAFDFWASRSFGNIVLLMQQQGRDEVTQRLLEKGERSLPYVIRTGSPPGTGQIIRDYLRFGFAHIIPLGADHILFVLGLFLLSARLGPLLWQVTAFTLAHSVSLALSTYGVVSVSPRVVEPLIALSIACVAIENIATARLHAWRPVVVFLFGLLHGLGFAGVLTELGLPRGQFVPALVSFNVGVEAGQLAVIAAAMLAVGRLRGRPWYRRRVVIPASAVIACVGLFWTVQRVIG